MRIERVSNNKVKFIFSLDDLEEWNIDFENLSYNSFQAQEMFWNMIKRAEAEAGFYVDDSQLIIEAMVGYPDGFVITVTRVDLDDDFDQSMQKMIKGKFKRSELRAKRKNVKVYSGIMIYSFRSFEDVCEASVRLAGLYSGDSSLYKYKDMYYLCLFQNSMPNTSPKAIEMILSEYGKKLPLASVHEGVLNEHGTLIIANIAAETLQKFF